MILKDTAEVITVNTNAATQSCEIFETKQTCHNILEIAIQLISISIASHRRRLMSENFTWT